MAIIAPSQAPLTARWATLLWLLAVGAGVAESVVGAAGAIADGVSASNLVAQIAVRTVIYGALFVVIDRFFRHGVPWSRYLLVGLLGTVGFASLVYGPATWLLGGGEFAALPRSAEFLAEVALRSVHLTALVTALAFTFHPETTRWFRR